MTTEEIKKVTQFIKKEYKKIPEVQSSPYEGIDLFAVLMGKRQSLIISKLWTSKDEQIFQKLAKADEEYLNFFISNVKLGVLCKFIKNN